MYYNYNISHGLGARADGDADFDGCMSHVHFCDGYSYAPTEFGETDSTTGEWKIKLLQVYLMEQMVFYI